MSDSMPGAVFFGCPTAIWVVHACSGSGIGELAIQWALQRLWDKGKHIAFIGGLAYEINADALALQQIINEGSSITLKQMGNLNTWPQDAISVLRDPTILILLAAGTPCEKISRGALFFPYNKKVGLHAAPSNLIWKWHEGIVQILKKRENRNVAIFSEQVIPFDPKISRQIAGLLGETRTVECSQWGGAARLRDFYMHPAPTVSPIPVAVARTYNLGNDWIWPALSRQPAQEPPPHFVQSIRNLSSATLLEKLSSRKRK